MSLLRGPSPHPRATPQCGEAVQFPESPETVFGQPIAITGALVQEVVLRRRSGNSFAEIDPNALGSLLWYSVRTQAVNNEDPARELRPVPSAGALHPIHLLLSTSPSAWQRYVAGRHSLAILPAEPTPATQIWGERRSILDPGFGTLLLLVGDLRLGSAYYDHPETLLLRDSGCLLGHLGLVAEALGLSYRILGPTGEPWASALRPDLVDSVAGVGMAIVGGRVSHALNSQP